MTFKENLLCLKNDCGLGIEVNVSTFEEWTSIVGHLNKKAIYLHWGGGPQKE